MDALSILRMLGALLLVLGGMVCALWVVKRYDLAMPRSWLARIGQGAPRKRLEVVERLAIDQRRSLVLLRRDDTEFSVLLGPEGITVLDRALEGQAPSGKAEAAPPEKGASAFGAKLESLPEVWFARDGYTSELH